MKKLLYLPLLLVIFSSCSSQKEVLYLQNNIIDADYAVVEGGEIRLQPDDMISIVVSSKDPELAAIFNLPAMNATTPSGIYVGSISSGGNNQNRVLCYTVSPDGEIDYPVLGRLKIEGMTKFELANMIQTRILESEMIKDPIITIEFVNLSFSTLGDVNSPGNYPITKDKTTILEALSMSGDLAITALRDRVFLIRNTEDGSKRTYQLDLTSTSIYQSPAFYIQQNDVIYVEPNETRVNQSTVNGNTVRSTSFWISLSSLLLTLTLLFVN